MKSDFDPRKAHETGDTLPEQANVYVPPRPLAQISDHRTMDFKAIRIAAELDPRQAKTQLRLSLPPRHRRGLPLFVVGSAIVLALFGVSLYMEFAREAPLPLVTTGAAQVPAAPAPSVPSPANPAQAGPTTAALPSAATTLAPASTSTETVAATAVPNAPTATATSARRKAPSRSAPRKAKVTREPWLE
jgi:hypothetical protein